MNEPRTEKTGNLIVTRKNEMGFEGNTVDVDGCVFHAGVHEDRFEVDGSVTCLGEKWARHE